MSTLLNEILVTDAITFGIIILMYFICTNIKRNSIVGYKTRQSLLSDKHWKIAQNYAFSLFFILIPLQIITHSAMYVMIADWSLYASLIQGVTFANIGIVIILVIYATEKKLSTIEE